jgi:hypothetical protein
VADNIDTVNVLHSNGKRLKVDLLQGTHHPYADIKEKVVRFLSFVFFNVFNYDYGQNDLFVFTKFDSIYREKNRGFRINFQRILG